MGVAHGSAVFFTVLVAMLLPMLVHGFRPAYGLTNRIAVLVAVARPVFVAMVVAVLVAMLALMLVTVFIVGHGILLCFSFLVFERFLQAKQERTQTSQSGELYGGGIRRCQLTF